MTEVNVIMPPTENRSSYLADAKAGKQIEVTSRGKVIARLVLGGDPHQDARERLFAIREHCHVGDVIKPARAKWNAER